jgi:hypothetical protein
LILHPALLPTSFEIAAGFAAQSAERLAPGSGQTFARELAAQLADRRSEFFGLGDLDDPPRATPPALGDGFVRDHRIVETVPEFLRAAAAAQAVLQVTGRQPHDLRVARSLITSWFLYSNGCAPRADYRLVVAGAKKIRGETLSRVHSSILSLTRKVRDAANTDGRAEMNHRGAGPEMIAVVRKIVEEPGIVFPKSRCYRGIDEDTLALMCVDGVASGVAEGTLAALRAGELALRM